MKTLIALVPLAFLAACSQAVEAPATVAVTDAWCRAAPTGAPAGGCYLTLVASAGDRLVAVETSAADRAEIHSMDMTDGVMRMRRLDDGLALPAGRAVMLKPGAEHLMVIGPKEPLAAGGEVPLTLRFEKAPAQEVVAPIRVAGTPGHAAGGH